MPPDENAHSPDPDTQPLGEPTPGPGARTGERTWLLIAVAALVVGLVAGGLVGALLAGGDDDDEPVAAPTPTSTTTSTIESRRLPESCWTALDEARLVLELVDRGVTAISEFEAAELDAVLDEVEVHRSTLTESIAECRDETGL